MLFCDQVFQFLELEESLYFTALDVEFHSAGKQPFTQNNLLEINFKHASAMTVNEKASLPTKAPNDLEELIRDYLYDNTERTEKCFKPSLRFCSKTDTLWWKRMTLWLTRIKLRNSATTSCLRVSTICLSMKLATTATWLHDFAPKNSLAKATQDSAPLLVANAICKHLN